MAGTGVRFVEGWVTMVRLLDGARYVWWGRDESDDDLLGTTDGGVVAVGSADELLRVAEVRGWSRDARVHVDEDSDLDLRPAQAWIWRRTALDACNTIDLWNFAEDVLRSTTGDRLTGGAATDGLHAHLTEVAVPFLARGGRPGPWSAADLRRLRRVLGSAERVVQAALTGRPVRRAARRTDSAPRFRADALDHLGGP